jgi:hypothetical protein
MLTYCQSIFAYWPNSPIYVTSSTGKSICFKGSYTLFVAKFA